MKSRKLMMGLALAAALMIPLAGCGGKDAAERGEHVQGRRRHLLGGGADL